MGCGFVNQEPFCVRRQAVWQRWHLVQERLRGFVQRLAEPGDSAGDSASAAACFFTGRSAEFATVLQWEAGCSRASHVTRCPGAGCWAWCECFPRQRPARLCGARSTLVRVPALPCPHENGGGEAAAGEGKPHFSIWLVQTTKSGPGCSSQARELAALPAPPGLSKCQFSYFFF